jgi:hypothetical protein
MINALKFAFRLVALGLLSIMLSAGVLIGMGVSPMPVIDHSLNQIPAQMVSWTGLRSAQSVVRGSWPPAEGERYPDLVLTDQHGETLQLSELAGKVILLELAAVPCKGCQAFSGGNRHGGFAGVPVQPGLDSIHDYAAQYGRVKLGQDEDVVFVQLLLYGNSMTSPTQQEVAAWAEHFHLHRASGEIVLRGDPSMLGPATHAMIPGFHLIDRDFVLRYDSSGHQPRHDLYRDLLPALGEMSRD